MIAALLVVIATVVRRDSSMSLCCSSYTGSSNNGRICVDFIIGCHSNNSWGNSSTTSIVAILVQLCTVNLALKSAIMIPAATVAMMSQRPNHCLNTTTRNSSLTEIRQIQVRHYHHTRPPPRQLHWGQLERADFVHSEASTGTKTSARYLFAVLEKTSCLN